MLVFNVSAAISVSFITMTVPILIRAAAPQDLNAIILPTATPSERRRVNIYAVRCLGLSFPSRRLNCARSPIKVVVVSECKKDLSSAPRHKRLTAMADKPKKSSELLDI
jgi:hypothetical protein